MGSFHEQFGVFAIYAFSGVLFRQFAKLSKKQVQLLSMIFTYVTCPCLSFSVTYGIFSIIFIFENAAIKKWPTDGVFLILVFIGYYCIIFPLSLFIFRKQGLMSKPLTFSSIGFNIGAFFVPIMLEVGGYKAAQKVVLFDVMNAQALNIIVPLLMYLTTRGNQNEPTKLKEIEIEENADSRKRNKFDKRNSQKSESEIELMSVSTTPPNEEQKETTGNPEMSVKDNQDNDILLSNEESEETKDLKEETKDILSGNEVDENESNMESSKPTQSLPFRAALRHILKTVLSKPLLYAPLIGLACGLSGVKLPHFIESVLNIGVSGNTFVTYFLIGVLFDYHIEKKYIIPCIMSLGFRCIVGVAIGIGFYFILPLVDPNHVVIDELTRFSLYIVFVMPPAMLISIWCGEFSLDAAVSSVILNFGNVLSFIVLLIMLSCVDLPTVA